ncbi:MAG: ATP-binding cassette domain-containing protein [Paracoccaceae bacterium]
MIELRNLCLRADGPPILRDISLKVSRGETLGLVGPSGAGKSSLAMLLLRLLDGRPAAEPRRTWRRSSRYRWSGQALVAGIDMLTAPALPTLRGRHIGLIVQSLSDALNPQLTIRAHICEMLALHQITGTRPEDLCRRYNLPQRLLGRRPSSLSGGETQRVLVALALLPQPQCLILDEPTAALDPDNQALVLAAIEQGRAQRAQILISHDPDLVLSLADRLAVMDAGRIVETGPVNQLRNTSKHPLTRTLLHRPVPRAPTTVAPVSSPVVLRVHRLSHTYGAQPVLKNTELSLRSGECLAVVGSSGCGKSTLARLVTGLEPIQSGVIDWPGPQSSRRGERPAIGYVSQHPHRALTAHFTVSETLGEALILSRGQLRWYHNLRGHPSHATLLAKALRAVSLPVEQAFLQRRTAELSGGEAQRLCLARALISDPAVIVADEPTSALDSCSKAEVVNTLCDLKSRMGKAILLVTHDALVADSLADRQLELRHMVLAPRQYHTSLHTVPTTSLS